jgi:hypothetical protein
MRLLQPWRASASQPPSNPRRLLQPWRASASQPPSNPRRRSSATRRSHPHDVGVVGGKMDIYREGAIQDHLVEDAVLAGPRSRLAFECEGAMLGHPTDRSPVITQLIHKGENRPDQILTLRSLRTPRSHQPSLTLTSSSHSTHFLLNTKARLATQISNDHPTVTPR